MLNYPVAVYVGGYGKVALQGGSAYTQQGKVPMAMFFNAACKRVFNKGETAALIILLPELNCTMDSMSSSLGGNCRSHLQKSCLFISIERKEERKEKNLVAGS